MSGRRNGSVSRAAETASKNRLHMDRNPQHSRITDPSNPAGRRKEIDNVMKRARQASPGSWDRKLLEVEEKDPNRTPMLGRRSRSPAGRRSRSPALRRSRSPPPRRSPRRSPRKSRERSARRSPRRTPVRRSPLPAVRRRSPRPRSPPRRVSPRRVSPRRVSPRRVSPRRVSPRRVSPRRTVARARPPPAQPPPRQRPPSPPDPRKSSGSGSSMSSCSDESCSVCSAKNKKTAPPPPPRGAKPPPRPAADSPNRKRPVVQSGARAVQPTRELLKAREASKRSREEKVLEWQRSQLAAGAVVGAAPLAAHVKREGERRPAGAGAGAGAGARGERARGVSPAAIAAALADSDSDSESDASSDPPAQRLTLSERFGKMAQWSADRSARLENMRITRREATLHVHIEKDEADAERVAADPDGYPGLDPAPIGSYPEELLAVAPGGLPSWDDVRVRYDYYKKRGYLRGLTLSDYVKWEEWWYKYQEWLKRERAYERWADGDMGTTRRERRRRGGRHRRS